MSWVVSAAPFSYLKATVLSNDVQLLQVVVPGLPRTAVCGESPVSLLMVVSKVHLMRLFNTQRGSARRRLARCREGRLRKQVSDCVHRKEVVLTAKIPCREIVRTLYSSLTT